MNTKIFLLSQAPTSNIRGCIEDSLHFPSLPSPDPSPLPRRRVNKKPTRFREAPDHLVKLPKEGHRYLSKDGRPLWDDRYAYPRPVPRRARSKRCPRARIGSPSPFPEAIAQSEPASPAKKRRIKFIVKKPLVEINGNKPPTKIKLKLNPTRYFTQSTFIILHLEDAFHSKPMINISVPDHVQAMLVDDWENITKNNQLVPLPHPKPVSKIFEDYLAVERPRREEGSSSMDILEEVIAGFREYFEKALSRILLYRFERHQYMDVRKLWDNAEENSQYKNVCDVYGAEHLARLIVSLPELLAQTNMDQQSVSRLREEIGKFTSWLGRNCETYFVNEYETPSQEYIDKARSF
ncbi:chromatin modification-related protein eaf3 [Trichoderma asperellum]|uniref:Chromatin modification-related protein EAF3 n=1 Tax=Trichoderma asperellum TaxID=101201 RepID=A0A6V8QJK7_TRIAP|nr:chromatin modification-related protein eaf3 [Trichoderma asperellum]